MTLARLPALLALLAAAALIPALAVGAPEPCEESLANCDTSEGQSTVVPMEARTIAAVVDLRTDNGDRARELYRSLIPRGYGMPDDPAVAVYLVEPNVPRFVAGQPYNDYSRWIEGAIAIKVTHPSGDGFYPLVMPVNSGFEYDIGRAAGLPKYRAEAFMRETPTGWLAEAGVKGKVSQRLEWVREQPPGDVSATARAFIRQRFPLLALFPALRGPELMRTKFTVTKPNPDPTTAPAPPLDVQPEPEVGTVKLDLAPDLDALDDTLPDLFAARGASLDDLIVTKATVPGLMWNVKQNLLIQTKRLGSDGGYGPPGSLQPAARPCLARTARVSSKGVGRLRPGRTRNAIIRAAGVPARQSLRALRYCVRGGGSVGVAFAKVGPRARAQLILTTARGHRARRLQQGASGRVARSRVTRPRKLRRGLRVGGVRERGSRVLVGLRGSRIRFLAVGARRLDARPRKLSTLLGALAQTGLRP